MRNQTRAIREWCLLPKIAERVTKAEIRPGLDQKGPRPNGCRVVLVEAVRAEVSDKGQGCGKSPFLLLPLLPLHADQRFCNTSIPVSFRIGSVAQLHQIRTRGGGGEITQYLEGTKGSWDTQGLRVVEGKGKEWRVDQQFM